MFAPAYLLPTDGSGKLENLTPDNSSLDQRPRFAPDGKSLVFVRSVRPNWSGENERLWRHDLKTGKNTPLTASLDYSFGEYTFSPESGALWLMAEEQGLLPLFKMNPDGSGFAKVYGAGTSSSDYRKKAWYSQSRRAPQNLIIASVQAEPAGMYNGS